MSEKKTYTVSFEASPTILLSIERYHMRMQERFPDRNVDQSEAISSMLALATHTIKQLKGELSDVAAEYDPF